MTQKQSKQKDQSLEIEILMDEPQELKGTGFMTTIFTIIVMKGKPMKDFFLKEIWIDGSNIGSHTTDKFGRVAIERKDLNPDQNSLGVAVVTDTQRFSQAFKIPKLKEKKAGWIEVKMDNPGKDGKAKGNITIRESENGSLTQGFVKISSNRPFSFAKGKVPNRMKQSDFYQITVDGQMIFEVEMSRILGYNQQQLFFFLPTNGMEIKIFLARAPF